MYLPVALCGKSALASSATNPSDNFQLSCIWQGSESANMKNLGIPAIYLVLLSMYFNLYYFYWNVLLVITHKVLEIQLNLFKSITLKYYFSIKYILHVTYGCKSSNALDSNHYMKITCFPNLDKHMLSNSQTRLHYEVYFAKTYQKVHTLAILWTSSVR